MATASASFNLYLHRFRQARTFHHPSLPSRLLPQTLFSVVTPHRLKRIAVAPLRPPTPPSPDPPPHKNKTQLTSVAGVASMIQDRVKIFIALLIWISLFFWASALQGRDRGDGKGKKDSRFK